MPSSSRLSWWLVVGEAAFVGLLGTLGTWLTFSMLPLSVAVLVIVATVGTFPLTRRLSAGDHFLYVSVTFFALGIVFVLLLHWLGREHFKWALDWSY